jgi:hypothetical protein
MTASNMLPRSYASSALSMFHLLLAAIALLPCLCGSAAVTISNVLPRRDVNGSLMDLHDGTILQVNGTYFYWGMSYGLCNITKSGCDGLWYPPHCGYRTDHNLSLYSSPDLVSWTFVLDALPMPSRPSAVYYRPQVVHNAATGLFVLWINTVSFWPNTQDPNYFTAYYLVATTPSPLAPFTVVGPATTSQGALGVGDLSLFVDPADGAGYIAYAAWASGVHAVSIERLTPSYLNSTLASSGVVTPPFYEAPLLFARSGAYLLLAGPTCCFCAEGAASRLYVAASPLGPWADSGSWLDPPGTHPANASLLGAQNSLLLAVQMADGTQGLLWAGDRWASAPDGLFGHNLQFWGLVQWEGNASAPRVAALQWQSQLTLDLA